MSFFPEPLPAEALRWRFDPGESLPLEGEAPSARKFIGQERAQRALSIGLEMRASDFNLYIAGPPGTGKLTMCRNACERVARERPVPNSLVFVHNFSDSRSPIWLALPPGLGRAFRDDMHALIAELREAIPKAFEDDAQEGRRKEIIEDAQSRQRELFSGLEERAKKEGFAIRPAQAGFALIPLLDGEPATEEDFEKFSSEDRERIEKARMAFGEHIGEFVKRTRVLEKEVRKRMGDLEREIGFTVVRGPIQDLKDKYRDFQKTCDYLDAVQRHILENLTNFRPSENEGGNGLPLMMRRPGEENPFQVYEVNVIVDTSDLDCAPVVFETNPTFANLFGRIERRPMFGTYTTDFTMVRGGAMIAASGGFLIMNALDLLLNPGSWPALKRAIRTRSVRIEDLGEMYGWSQSGLKPEPVEVDTKVILMGSPMLYYLLLRHDEDFGKLFKMKADIASTVDRTPESLRDFRRFVEFNCKDSGLLPVAEVAVGRLLEECARSVSHKEKLSARFSELRELLLEADHWARRAGAEKIEEEHVFRALDEKRFRADLLDERLRDLIVEGTLMIDVEGAVIGQVNGLAVLDLGDYSFGKPSRITAQTFMGEKGVVNIERESKLSGSIHDKGVLILQGYLGATYAQKRPLALSASITFEQNYSGVDGDSASSTELYAILSSLAELPIKQGFAVTGSVNQRGEIQPIGGVNEKIEGFFEVCKEKGALNGEQGVLIPHQNVRNLMLREEVIGAVRENKFGIFPVRTVNEGISLLTGVPAGERDPQTGGFPPDTVHGRVDAKFQAMFDNLMRLRRRGGKTEEEEEKGAAPEKKPPSPPEPPPRPPERGG